MQKRSKEDLLKILKSYRNLQKPVLKTGRNNLKNFESNSEPLKDLSENFEDASEREVESKAFSGDFNKD